jgi:hypothetical protein
VSIKRFTTMGKSISLLVPCRKYKSLQCGNPALLDTSTVCRIISDSKGLGRRKELFSSERILYDEAAQRCTETDILQMPVTLPRERGFCDDVAQGGCDKFNIFYWLNAPCSISVKVSYDILTMLVEVLFESISHYSTLLFYLSNSLSYSDIRWIPKEV